MLELKGYFLAPYFYFYGSIPFAFIFTYLFKRKIIYKEGTGNVGVANTFAIAGLLPGFLTVFGEISKAVFPILIAYFFINKNLYVALLLVLASLLGTNFSIFLAGRGGMGSTIIIYSLALLSIIDINSLWILLTMGGSFFLGMLITRDSTWTNRIAYATLPFIIYGYTRDFIFAGWGLIIAILYIAKYRKSKDEAAVFKVKDRGFKQFFNRKKHLVIPLQEVSRKSEIGKKAENLSFLQRNNFLIPKTLLVTFNAYNNYKENKTEIFEDLKSELIKYIDPDDCCFSIRSSANIEDSSEYSYAGQFETYLNVVGIDDILEKIEFIWNSFENKHSTSYLNEFASNDKELQMGIILQNMIDPKYAGVVFTKNPLTGLDETIVELVEGLGDKLVQGLVTPDRWIYKWGKWIEQPKDRIEQQYLVNELVYQSNEIAKKYKHPVDLEWVYNGEKIYWLQLREITTLKHNRLYSNKISREFLPGIIKPLIWSINIPVVNTSWKMLFQELIGSKAKKIDVNNLAKSFYYRAYFNMGVIGDIFELLGMPRELLELLGGIVVPDADPPKYKPTKKTFRYMPRMIIFALKKSVYSFAINRYLRKYSKKLKEIENRLANDLTISELIANIEILYDYKIIGSYVVIVSQLLNSLYNMLMKRRLSKHGIEIETLPISNIYQKLNDIDPRSDLITLNKDFNNQPEKKQNEFKSTKYSKLTTKQKNSQFIKKVDLFLNKFGHFRDSGNDFSQPTWRETPDIVFEMIINYNESDTNKDTFNPKIKRPIDKLLYRRSLRYLEYRERVNYLYQYGYGLFRDFFLSMSQQMVNTSLISSIEDIFYLSYEEIKQLISNEKEAKNFNNIIQQRKKEIKKYQNITLPELIFSDDQPEPITDEIEIKSLKGVPTSKGSYSGIAKIIRGREDFIKVKEGDIIIIPYSDVSWTPLFAKAKAVISESGGMLSHCSIVAREYQIPAIVSVKDAMKIEDESLISVDGFNGKITILEKQKEDEKC